MSRYIDADALYELIDGGYDVDFDEVPETKKALLAMIDNQETEDVRENVRGYWIGKPLAGYGKIRCSACRWVFENATGSWKYCPECGAKMEQ